MIIIVVISNYGTRHYFKPSLNHGSREHHLYKKNTNNKCICFIGYKLRFNNRRIILWIECLRTRCVSNGTASLINKCRNQWSYCVPLSFPFLLPIVSTKYGGSSQEGTKYLTFTTCTWATLLPAYCKCAHGYIEPRFSSSCVFSFGSFAISRYSD